MIADVSVSACRRMRGIRRATQRIKRRGCRWVRGGGCAGTSVTCAPDFACMVRDLAIGSAEVASESENSVAI